MSVYYAALGAPSAAMYALLSRSLVRHGDVRRTAFPWGDYYRGKKEDLIAMGFPGEWFPGEPGRNKCSQMVLVQPGKLPSFTFRQTKNCPVPDAAILLTIKRATHRIFTVELSSRDLVERRRHFADTDDDLNRADEAWAAAQQVLDEAARRTGGFDVRNRSGAG